MLLKLLIVAATQFVEEITGLNGAIGKEENQPPVSSEINCKYLQNRQQHIGQELWLHCIRDMSNGADAQFQSKKAHTTAVQDHAWQPSDYSHYT